MVGRWARAPCATRRRTGAQFQKRFFEPVTNDERRNGVLEQLRLDIRSYASRRINETGKAFLFFREQYRLGQCCTQ